jgi:rubrerythrin
MIAFNEVSELVRLALRLERKLKDFYDVAEVALQNPESKRVVAQLRDRLEEKLAALAAVDTKRFGRGEYLKVAPDLREDEVVPRRGITRSSTPGEIIARILASEERLQRFYAEVSEKLVVRDQKDLFASLAAFKEAQLSDIRQLRPAP